MKSHLSQLILSAFLVAVALVLGACATTTGNKNSLSFDPPVQKPSNPSNVELKLSTGAQALYVVEGDNVLLATPAGVGKASTPTPAGKHYVRNKVANRRRISNPGSGYPMPYWIEFYSPAYGMHWGFVKPYPSTMGCVRLPLKAAPKVFDLVQVGTPIHVASSQPWDSTIGQKLPKLDDTPLPNPPMSYMTSDQVFADIRKGKLWTF